MPTMSSALAAQVTPSATAPAPVATVPEGLPTIDAADMAHFAEILGALTQREQMYAQALSSELAPAQLRTWIAELKQLSVADAVARIRVVLGVTDATTTDANAGTGKPGLPPGGAS